MEPRYFKICPQVALVTGRGNKVLEDKDQSYPEGTWPAGQADELVRRGFIYEVTEKSEQTEKKIETPENNTKVETVKPGKGRK